MNNRKILPVLVIAVAVILALIVLVVPWGVVNAQEGVESPEPEEVTDSVRFDADLRAEEKDLEVVGQYARTSINNQITESVYSEVPLPRQNVGDACVNGGGTNTGCGVTGDVASASTENGMMAGLDADRRILLALVSASVGVTEEFSTGARCFVGEDGVPEGQPQQPTGEIAYSASGLLGSRIDKKINLTDVASGYFFSDEADAGVLLDLLLPLTAEVEISSSWGWDEENLRAYSEVAVEYRIIDGSTTSAEKYTARSECGMFMSDDTGSKEPASMGQSAAASLQALRLADPEAPETTGRQVQPTSAPGTPQSTGFTEESSLTADDGANYHLLSTRELGLLDREHILEVLAATRETGAVEGETSGARWWLYSAEAAGEQVPVLEIELANATVVQARPNLPGIHHPVPDEAPSETQPSATPSTTTEQLPEPTTQPPAEPTSEPIPTTPEESGEDAEND